MSKINQETIKKFVITRLVPILIIVVVAWFLGQLIVPTIMKVKYL